MAVIEQGKSAVGIRSDVNELKSRNYKVGFAIGDSITFQNSDNNANLQGGNCYWGVLSWLSGGRIVFRGQAGIPGETSGSIAARFADEALTYPGIDLDFILAGTNNVTAGNSVAVTIAPIVAMCRASRASGRQPVVLSVPPRGDNAGYNTATITLNAALQPAVEAEGAVWADVFTPLAASGYAVGSANTGDGIHPKAAGVKIMAQTILARLEELALIASAKAWNLLPETNAISMIPNAGFTTSGTQSGFGAMPNGWLMSGTVSATTTITADATSGANLLNIAVSGAGSNTLLTDSAFPLGTFAGKTAAFRGRLKTSGLEATASKLRIRIEGTDTDTSFNLMRHLLYDLQIDGDGYFYGEVFVPASANVTGSIRLDIISLGACVVSIGEMTIDLIPDLPNGYLGTRQKRVPMPVRTVSANYTLGIDEYCLYVDATAGPITITLPAAGNHLYGYGNYISAYQKPYPTQGLEYLIIKKDSSGNAVTVQRAGSDTINGGTSVNTTTQYGRINPICVARTVWVA